MRDEDHEASGEPLLTVVPAEPTPRSEDRIGSLDLIRGLAILGILPVNMASYMAPGEGMAPPQPAVLWWGENLVAAGILFFFAGKMITQLAVLFGAGLAIQSDRADAAGRPFVNYYLWRMTLLLLLGLAHALLLWWGDILLSYALLGAAALLLRRFSRRALVWCVAGLLTWNYLLLLGVTTITVWMNGQVSDQNFEQNLPGLASYITASSEVRIYQHGPWTDMVINRALHLALYLVFFAFWVFWDLLSFFLLGLYLLRRGVFHDPGAHRVFLRRVILVGLGAGIPLDLVAAFIHAANPLDPVPLYLNMAGSFPQALGYLALTLFWYQSHRAPRIQARLQAVGRMALTNYLMQSVLCGLVFYSYGLAQFGKWGHTAGFALTLGIWALELVWSPIWLRYFAMGPVEWVWRSLADRRWRPFVRRSVA